MWQVNFLGFFLYLSGSLIETVGYVGQLLEMSPCFRLQVKRVYSFCILRNSVYIRMLAAFASIRKMKARHKYGFCQQSLICVARWWKVSLDDVVLSGLCSSLPTSRKQVWSCLTFPASVTWRNWTRNRCFSSCSSHISIVQWWPDS